MEAYGFLWTWISFKQKKKMESVTHKEKTEYNDQTNKEETCP